MIDAYLSLIQSLKALILSAGKQPYVLAMGKPSPAKLGNFLDLEAFVLVACPENSLLDSREFHVPVVTPDELLLALGPNQTWTGVSDLSLSSVASRISASLASAPPERTTDDEEDAPYFSLVTGTYKMRSTQQQQEEVKREEQADGTVTQRDAAGALLSQSGRTPGFSSAGTFFNESRTFKGLEIALGETAISETIEGRRGIASGYSTEPPNL
jgi:diphthamide biosynthesis protein 2